MATRAPTKFSARLLLPRDGCSRGMQVGAAVGPIGIAFDHPGDDYRPQVASSAVILEKSRRY